MAPPRIVALVGLLCALATTASAAGPDVNAPGFWVQSYWFPAHYQSMIVEVRPTDMGAAKLQLAALMKACSGQLALNESVNQIRQIEMVRTLTANGQMTTSSRQKPDQPGDDNNLWEVPTASVPALSQQLLSLGVLMHFQQFDESVQVNAPGIEVLLFKRDRLQAEMAALGKNLEKTPGISGLLEAQMKTMQGFISSHEKARDKTLIRVALRTP